MGVSEARSALRRAQRDQLLAIVWIASASIRVRLARQRLRVHRTLWRWRVRARKQLRSYAASSVLLRSWLG
jgi:hypothetical protein